MQLLEFLDSQLQSANEAGLFRQEARMISLVVKHMAENDHLTLSSPLSELAAAAHNAQAEAVGEREQMQNSAASQTSIAAVRELMKPYTFQCIPDTCEMTVTIKVPPATKTANCKVEIKRETLTVAVAGHTLQPTVLDGRFLHPVDPSASEWHLEGSGEQRVLVLDLENTSAGLDWSRGLLAAGSSGGQAFTAQAAP